MGEGESSLALPTMPPLCGSTGLSINPNADALGYNDFAAPRLVHGEPQGISNRGTSRRAAWEPQSGALWAAVNERDELGSDLVPDYMTAVRDGGFYGFPFSYYGQHVDTRVKPQRPDLVASAIVPDFALGPHTGSLGLVSSRGAGLPAPFADGMFVGQHGSWNRKPLSGYKVIFVPFANGRPSGPAIDVANGFVNGDDARGRPVGLAIDKRGALLIADDVGNTVWRVAGTSSQTMSRSARP